MESDSSNTYRPTNNFFDDHSSAYQPSQSYVMMTPQYVPHRGLVRYSQALKHLIPVRKKSKKKNVLKVDSAGFLSFITCSWMTKYVWQAYKHGLTVDDIPLGSQFDACDLNSQRLEMLWHEELKAKGAADASFGRVIWRFARTRLLLACATFSFSCIMGFLSPTIFMRKLLEYSESNTGTWSEGIVWAVALSSSDLLRALFHGLCWSISYRTAVRLRAACLGLLYRKLLTLDTLEHKSSGEIINLFSNDGPRLFYMVVFGPMIIGGPLVTICGIVYILLLLGPWALCGMLAFLFFYPVQYGLSRLTGYYRGRSVQCADQRVQLMNELLNSIKLIKMYAWESCFSSNVNKTRKKELKEIQKTNICQSLSVTMAPTVPVISGIVTFIAHVLTGGNLTASQAFSILPLFSRYLRLAIALVKDGMNSVHQGQISLPRIKAFPVLTFTSKQLRMAIKHLQESCNALQEGMISMPRFKAFPLIVILCSQLRSSLLNLRYGCENIVDGDIAIRRLQEILLMEKPEVSIKTPKDPSLAIEIDKGTFVVDVLTPDSKTTLTFWERLRSTAAVNEAEEQTLNPPAPKAEYIELLSHVSVSIKKGSLVGVCGAVGSGKSSFLLACLGQLKIIQGQLYRAGRVAYVSQKAWLQNATLKENVLFGEPFEPKRYFATLHSCALNEDVHLLPGEDETEVGERGVTLSGGQKQRLALARAVYAERDIYLLDDPLSAVDSHVGSHIFEQVILGALRGRTTILVTHQVPHLQRCDTILVMKNGAIVAQGTHGELLASSSDYSLIVQATEFSTVNLSKDVGSTLQLDKLPSPTSPKSPDKENGPTKTQPSAKITQAEEQLKGEVKSYAYTAYINAAGGRILSFIAILSILITTGTNAFSSYWLALWIKQGGGNTTVLDPVTNETVHSTNITENPDMDWYISIYAGTIGVIVLTSAVRSIIFTKLALRAGRRMHENLFGKLMRSPLRYFETTPVGRILNMFARDLDETDNRLPGVLETMLQNIWVVAFAFLFITMVFPWFIIPLVILAVLYYYISKIFRVAVRDLQRIDNISRAPILSSVSTTIQGLPTIHAFGKENDFHNQFMKTFDENSTCLFMNCIAMRWMATRLDSISVTIMCITALLVVLLKDQVPGALAGLALTYAAQISGVFQYTIRLISETEARFISVERIQNSIQTMDAEGNTNQVQPPPGWPTKGSIRFKDVVLSYGKDLPDVLHSFNLSVRAGEKLGVVGRTGAGKSSLIVALFRLTELNSGSIQIDGVDISTLDLHALRSAMAVIPQDPVLFAGTFRHNLDPFGKYPDDVLWGVLKKTQLVAKVKSMENGLDAVVDESGDNLSVGERQLVCLARALLRGCKILLLDEATASVDPETEQAIQATIQKEFESCTVITIAHRLATVTSTDRVLLMDHGMVVELGDPNVLLSNRNSAFAKLAASMGFIPSS